MDRLVLVGILLLVLSVPSFNLNVLSRTTSQHSAPSSKHSISSNKHSKPTGKHLTSTGKHSSSAGRHTASMGTHGHRLIASSHSSNNKHYRHRSRRQRMIAKHYAYPMDMFLLAPPGFTSTEFPQELAHEVKEDFKNGIAGVYPASALVQAGVVDYSPLHGGIFWRRQPVKYLIMHSTETVVPRDAQQVVNGWNSLGRRHAGAQYVVDRDGRIYETVDPDLATVHVNILKTLPGINNDNSIGVEMVHAGRQKYTHDQLKSAVQLAVYLLQRYQIDLSNLVTHRYAQRGDHTDPVAFDWDSFIAQVSKLHKHAIGKEMVAITETVKEIPKSSTATALNPVASGAAEAAVVTNSKNDTEPQHTDTDLRHSIEVEPSAANTLLHSK